MERQRETERRRKTGRGRETAPSLPRQYKTLLDSSRRDCLSPLCRPGTAEAAALCTTRTQQQSHTRSAHIRTQHTSHKPQTLPPMATPTATYPATNLTVERTPLPHTRPFAQTSPESTRGPNAILPGPKMAPTLHLKNPHLKASSTPRLASVYELPHRKSSESRHPAAMKPVLPPLSLRTARGARRSLVGLAMTPAQP